MSVRHLRRSRAVAVLLLGCLGAAACSDDDGLEVATERVGTGEVVQTVAAVAELEPAARVAVTAPVGGDIARLLVDDGQAVSAGDPIAELSSESVELQIAQAESAAQAADALARAAGASGLDLSPILGAFRSQLEATLPPVLDALSQQAASIEDDELRAAAEQRVRDARDSYRGSRDGLLRAEREAAGQAQQATAAQREAAAAQRRQAEIALEAARGRSDDLTIVAPVDGVIELGRADAGAATVPDLGGLADQLGGGGVGAPDVSGLLEGQAGGGNGVHGPVAEGVSVSAGQLIATVYDLSTFTARVTIDEVDISEVERDQAVTVLVDAFPDAEIRGTVAHVAIAPNSGPAGGATFPVTVRLIQVPDDVQLRVGLTASAEVEVRRVEDALTVPTSALLRRGGQEVVFVVEDGRAREVPVTVLAIGDAAAAIEGDLEARDRVVTTGVETLEDGQELPG